MFWKHVHHKKRTKGNSKNQELRPVNRSTPKPLDHFEKKSRPLEMGRTSLNKIYVGFWLKSIWLDKLWTSGIRSWTRCSMLVQLKQQQRRLATSGEK
jgi:hypothetical protein